jgi:prolyl oligopeptidase
VKHIAPLAAGFIAAVIITGCARHAIINTPPRHPATRTVDVVGNYHGTAVPDPYRWLESLDAPEVRGWAAAQTAHTLSLIRATDAGTRLLARIGALNAFWAEAPDGSQAERRAPTPPPVDPATLGPGERLDDAWPSPDGRHIAYAVATPENGRLEVRIRRVADGVDLEERFAELDGHPLHWTRDGLGFFYLRVVQPTGGVGSARAERSVHYHVAGTPVAQDVTVLRLERDGTPVSLEFELSADGRFLVIAEGTGPWVDEFGHLHTRLHLLDLGDPMRPAIAGTPLALSAARDAAYRIVATRGDTLYLLTDRGAPRRRLVAFAADTPGIEHWRDVVPESDAVIDEVREIGEHLVVRYVRDVQHGVRVYQRDGRLVRELPIRPMTTILDMRPDASGALVIEAVEGFAPTRWRYSVAVGRDSAEHEVKVPSPADPYEIRQVWYTSKDGVQVPMFLAHRRGLPLDGTHPTILGGYGASSSIEMPLFGPPGVALLELGFVLAAPSLRGGGEFGREWYEAATLGRKQTTFDDFIAAAEYLVRERYTSADRLAIFGGSNGGLLVTSVITQRPDLFRVAVAAVPPTDLLRFDPGTHRAQYGSPDEPSHVPFLLASSSLYHVQPGTCYPATLITTAFNDDVIPAWHAFKFTAALQAAQSCDRPVLLRADTTGGHGGIGAEGVSDRFGFIMTQLGVEPPPAATRP